MTADHSNGVVRFTCTLWDKKTVPLMDPAELEGLDPDELKSAQAIQQRFAAIKIEVRRVNRPTRQGWDREFAKLLVDDAVLRHEAPGEDQGLHLNTIAKLDEFNHKILDACLVKVRGLIVGDRDVSELSQEMAVEQLAECGLTGYASKACRRCQSPTLQQGER